MSNEPGRGVTGVTGVVGWVGTKKQTIKAVTLQSGIIRWRASWSGRKVAHVFERLRGGCRAVQC